MSTMIDKQRKRDEADPPPGMYSLPWSLAGASLLPGVPAPARLAARPYTLGRNRVIMYNV